MQVVHPVCCGIDDHSVTTFDLVDDSPDCDNNTWRNNRFGTSEVPGEANPGCID